MAKTKIPKDWWIKQAPTGVLGEVRNAKNEIVDYVFEPSLQMIAYAHGLIKLRPMCQSNQEFYRQINIDKSLPTQWRKRYIRKDPETGEEKNYFLEWLEKTTGKFRADLRPFLQYHLIKRIEEGSDVILAKAAEAARLIGKDPQIEEPKRKKTDLSAKDIANMSEKEFEKFEQKYIAGSVGFEKTEEHDDSSETDERGMSSSERTDVAEVQEGSLVISNNVRKDS